MKFCPKCNLEATDFEYKCPNCDLTLVTSKVGVMKLKIFTISIVIIDILLVAFIVFKIFDQMHMADFTLTEAGAIGIIGGADGPTAIFLASKTPLYHSLGFLILCILNLLMIVLNIIKKVKR